MTVPFDEGSQIVHVVGRHAVYADAGSQLLGVPGDRVQRRNDQRGLERGAALRVADVGDEVLDVL